MTLIHCLLAAVVAVAAPESKPDRVRTLDAITIEGEIDLPQVLFITARDQHRFRDNLHRRYLKSCADLGGETPLPVRAKPVPKEK